MRVADSVAGVAPPLGDCDDCIPQGSLWGWWLRSVLIHLAGNAFVIVSGHGRIDGDPSAGR